MTGDDGGFNDSHVDGHGRHGHSGDGDAHRKRFRAGPDHHADAAGDGDGHPAAGGITDAGKPGTDGNANANADQRATDGDADRIADGVRSTAAGVRAVDRRASRRPGGPGVQCGQLR